MFSRVFELAYISESFTTILHSADEDIVQVDNEEMDIETPMQELIVMNNQKIILQQMTYKMKCHITCAKWILKTSESRKLTRLATIGIVQDVSELVKDVCSCVEAQISNCLERNGIDISTVSGLSDVFTSTNETVAPFTHLMTHHQQMTYYREHYNLIVSLCKHS